MPIYMDYGDIKGEAFQGTFAGPPYAFPPFQGNTDISPAQLGSCTTGDIATVCSGLSFQPDLFPLSDTLIFNFIDVASGVAGASIIQFADGSFNQFGRYTSIDGSATFSLSFVPEAATWLMLIIGFGLIGATMRRRTLRTA